ncbi:MAG: hypothetical protein A2Y17_08095 [Clostridiales bacterium GWF2_38_85]|nr:MAG: hypothetical protein A2Y17_08095 [Clostridiales bacterium GWF2_38_85]HBL83847.1 hypothetical protein [Clostridiales bacterium]
MRIYMAFIYFSIFGFDLLIDFVGWILVASGLKKLSEYHDCFWKARKYAVLLIFVSLLFIFDFYRLPLSPFFSSVFMLAWTVWCILEMYLIYYVFTATSEIAADCGEEALSNRLSIYWKVLIALKVASEISRYLTYLIPNETYYTLHALSVWAIFIFYSVVLCLAAKKLHGKFPAELQQQSYMTNESKGTTRFYE